MNIRILLLLIFFLVFSCKPENKAGKEDAQPVAEKSPALNTSGDRNLLTPYDPDTLKPGQIRIGLLVSQHPDGRDISLSAWQNAALAVRELNHSAAKNNKKIVLIVRSCDGPWGMGSTQAVNMAYKDSVTSIVASANGRNSHLIEQVVAKTHTPVVSAWATEPTLTEAFVPWFFRLVPNDRQQAQALADEIFKKGNNNKTSLISFGDYDSRQAARAFYQLVKKNGYNSPDTMDYEVMGKDPEIAARHIARSQAGSVLFMGHPVETKQIIDALLPIDKEITFYGNSWLASSGNLLYTTNASIPLKIISPSFTVNEAGNKFINDFMTAYGYKPDAAAAYAYDGIRLLYEAIRNAGTGQSALRDYIHTMHFDGITGDIQFDKHGNLVSGIELMKCGVKP